MREILAHPCPFRRKENVPPPAAEVPPGNAGWIPQLAIVPSPEAGTASRPLVLDTPEHPGGDSPPFHKYTTIGDDTTPTVGETPGPGVSRPLNLDTPSTIGMSPSTDMSALQEEALAWQDQSLAESIDVDAINSTLSSLRNHSANMDEDPSQGRAPVEFTFKSEEHFQGRVPADPIPSNEDHFQG